MLTAAHLGSRLDDCSLPIILYVEEDAGLRVFHWLSFWLEGYPCLPCESAEAALAVLRAIPCAISKLDRAPSRRDGADLGCVLLEADSARPLVLIRGNASISIESQRVIDNIFHEGVSRSALLREIFGLLSASPNALGSVDSQYS
jgi:hypothetical protein